MGQTHHAVDSIIDCKQSAIRDDQHRILLEMCCPCHACRAMWFQYQTVIDEGNEALQNLTIQTLEMKRKGLEIRSASPVSKFPYNQQDHAVVSSDNFSMHDLSDEDF